MNDGLDRLIQIFKDHDVQIPCPGEQSCLLKYLKELRDWRTNPFKMIKERCECVSRCDQCDWNNCCFNCCSNGQSRIPEDWKFSNEESQ